MSSDTYELIDEPKGTMTHMAVAPMVLLLVTILTPKPYQFLAPLVFLVNAYLMGSYDIKKQTVIAVAGIALVVSMAPITFMLMAKGFIPLSIATITPYINILTNAALFIVVYKLFLLQSPTFALITYIREQRADT